MKEAKRKVLKVVERITREGVRRNKSVWPPDCSGIFHQPKRPVKDNR